MLLFMQILLMILIATIAIKFLKVVAWVVGILLIANFLTPLIGLVATIIVLAIMFLRKQQITDAFIVFICLAFLIGLL